MLTESSPTKQTSQRVTLTHFIHIFSPKKITATSNRSRKQHTDLRAGGPTRGPGPVPGDPVSTGNPSHGGLADAFGLNPKKQLLASSFTRVLPFKTDSGVQGANAHLVGAGWRGQRWPDICTSSWPRICCEAHTLPPRRTPPPAPRLPPLAQTPTSHTNSQKCGVPWSGPFTTPDPLQHRTLATRPRGPPRQVLAVGTRPAWDRTSAPF